VTGTLALLVDGCKLAGYGGVGVNAAGFGADPDDDDAVIRRCTIDGTGGAGYGIAQKGNNVLIEKNTIALDPGATAISLGFNDRVLARVRNNKMTGDLRMSRSVAFSEQNVVTQGELDLQGPVQRSSHDTVIDGELLVPNGSNI